MTIEVKVPMLPESIADATVATWHKKVGDSVSRDENLVDLETDKVMLEVPAPADGVLKEILKKVGAIVQANEIVALIGAGETKATTQKSESKKSDGAKENLAATETSGQETAKSKETGGEATGNSKEPGGEATGKSKETQVADKTGETAATDKTNASQGPSHDKEPNATTEARPKSVASATLSPSVRRIAAEHDVDVSQVQGTGKGGRITKENVMNTLTAEEPDTATIAPADFSERPEKRLPMTRIRARIAERLLEVTQNTAMLTTFNEINLQEVMGLRSKYKEKFEKDHHARLGFMSFFIKAAVEALKRFPAVNASIDGTDVVYHGYYDIGVAVSTDRGLVVPVLRDADKMSMAEIEITVAEYANKARNGKLTLEEMQGGTFSITNGGVFGSLLATPILNSPQSAILGMHKIQERPVVENGQVVIRPMMYVALSYDHRMIDGKESVSFLVAIKEFLEEPARMLLDI